MSERILLDASALLCVINDEKGSGFVEPFLREFCISAVNFSEVTSKLIDFGMSASDARTKSLAIPVDVIAFDAGIAVEAGTLRETTRPFGLSFADRACLATARSHGIRVLTADRAWERLSDLLSLEIVLVR